MPRPELTADCAACAALCCVVYPLDASEAFAHAKPAGVPCRHLGPGGRCGIHHQLVERGYPGCAAYDCFGAGQRATGMFAGVPGSERLRAHVFLKLREVHALLRLTDSPRLSAALEALAEGPLDALLEANLQELWRCEME